jgi:hypothetical protein
MPCKEEEEYYSTHNNCKHDKDQKMRPLRQGVAPSLRLAEEKVKKQFIS